MAEKTLTHSEAQAVAQLESIKAMVAALQCDYDRLEELRDERDSYESIPLCPKCGAELIEGSEAPGEQLGSLACRGCERFFSEEEAQTHTWAEMNPDEAEELAELESAAGDCKNEEMARQQIDEDPLSVEVRGPWYTPGAAECQPEEYCILLCTGGPAVRIIGQLDHHCEPHTARLEHQDWGTYWQEWITTGSDHEALLAYARCFCYGE